MQPTENGATPRENTLESAIDARLDSLDSASYERSNEVVLSKFATWADRRGVTKLDDVDDTLCRRYAQHLRRRTNSDDEDAIAASTAHRYYDIIRAWLGWCVRDDRLDTNPAERESAFEELPPDEEKTETQFWSVRERDRLLNHLDKRVDVALDDENVDKDERIQVFRDRAYIYLLALSGVRIGEILRNPNDDKRSGVAWADIDLENGILEVFGKVREYETTAVPSKALDRIGRYRRVLRPPTDDWPIIPTSHRPTLYAGARDALNAQMDAEDVEDLLDSTPIFQIYREYEIVPTALTTNGGRNLLERLCGEIDLEIDGEYLKPHGARRGLGDQLYAESAELAQEMLRHRSIETTHASYRDQHVVERRKEVDEIIEGKDG